MQLCGLMLCYKLRRDPYVKMHRDVVGWPLMALHMLFVVSYCAGANTSDLCKHFLNCVIMLTGCDALAAEL